MDRVDVWLCVTTNDWEMVREMVRLLLVMEVLVHTGPAHPLRQMHPQEG